MELVIHRIEKLNARVRLFSLSARRGEALPAYAPGAHLDVALGESRTRSYSLVDFTTRFAEPDRYCLAVQREEDGEGGSMAMHALSEGDCVNVTGPKNTFPLHEGNTPALLLAGGIGITPMPSLAAELARRGASFQLHYCVRSEPLAVFQRQLREAFGEAFRLCCDDSSPADLAALVGGVSPDAHIYCCGPAGMIEAVRDLAEAAGLPGGQFHYELFETPAAGEDDHPFEVELASTGQVFTIPVGRTIIEILEENGFDVMYDCQRGDCGICQTEVIEGTPDHRDVVLTEEERASGRVMQICVSRAKSVRLLLDL